MAIDEEVVQCRDGLWHRVWFVHEDEDDPSFAAVATDCGLMVHKGQCATGFVSCIACVARGADKAYEEASRNLLGYNPCGEVPLSDAKLVRNKEPPDEDPR